MSALEYMALAIAVTLAMLSVDFAHARYVRELVAGRRHAAARWSVLQWSAASVGFVVAVRVTMWLLPFEALGLYLGTCLGGTRGDTSRVDRA